MVNKKLIGIVLFIQIFSIINSLPYNVLADTSSKNKTTNELNSTFRAFNKINATIQKIIKRKNNTNVPKKSTVIESLSLDDNLNETVVLDTQALNSTIQTTHVALNLTLPETTVVTNTTIHVTTAVMNSTIILGNLTLEKADPLVEILDPIQELNYTDALNSTNITEIVEFDQNKTIIIRPMNIILNKTLEENVPLNVNEMTEPVVSDLERNIIHELNTVIRLVYIESFNKSVLSFDPHTIEESIKHAILKYIDSKFSHVCVNITFNNTVDPMVVTKDILPIHLNVTVVTPVVLTEDQFNSALVDFSINNKKCTIQNDTNIRCSLFRLKDSSSLLRISDYWIELNQLTPIHQKLNGMEYEIFTYKPAWIVGLAIIGGIIAIFFLGCIVAICYTRRPYRRCGKVYEIDSVVRKNNQPYIPGVHPATKAATITKPKEMYYQ